MAFGAKKTCPICGGPVKGLLNTKIKDKLTICNDCVSKSKMDYTLYALQSVEDMKKHLQYRQNNQEMFSSFKITREVKLSGWYFREDSNKGLWYYTNIKNPVNPPLFRYDEIADYEYTEDGITVTKGGVGSAVVGGLLFGATGAIVGGIAGKKQSKTEVTKMIVRLSLTNPYHNTLEINLNPSNTNLKVGSFVYNQMKEEAMALISFLDSLAHKASANSDQNISNSNSNSAADEILKYKNLLEIGAITQEEFEAKKKQLLNL